jgi:hypothetical protein
MFNLHSCNLVKIAIEFLDGIMPTNEVHSQVESSWQEFLTIVTCDSQLKW